MINITNFATKYGKKAGNFLDNPRIVAQLKEGDIIVKEGRNGFTMLHERHLPEFFLWLSPETRQMVLNGDSSDQIVRWLQNSTALQKYATTH